MLFWPTDPRAILSSSNTSSPAFPQQILASTMQLLTVFLSALSLVAATVAVPAELVERSTTLQVTYDTVYDDASNSLDIVSCSNGVNGLEPSAPSSRILLPTY